MLKYINCDYKKQFICVCVCIYNKKNPRWQGNDKKLTIDRQSFAQAVDRVSTISSERGRAVKMAISDGLVTLTVNNPDSGSATEEVAADYESDSIDIGFNAKYLLDITSQLQSSEAVFMLADSGSPTLIRDGADDSALYVLMPMRVWCGAP